MPLTRREFIKTVMAGSALSLFHSHCGLMNSINRKPNIVFILIDDMGWKDLGCFGAKLQETPNIDKLCAAGVRFPQAYTSTAICAPARATVLTGKHPMKLRMWNHYHFIPKREKILAQYLKDAGYQTWHIGKWHLGNEEDHTLPTDLGFDVNCGGGIAWAPGSYFWPYGCNTDGTGGNPRMSVPGLVPDGKDGEYLTDRLTEEALNLLNQRDPSKPFFLNFWHFAVHNRKEGKPALVEKYRRKIKELGLEPTYRIDPHTNSKLLTSETNAVYAAMIESVDESVGRLVDKLKQIGEYENTFF
ncbi:sulfatase-like hydrolase/transferase, partial [candidate division KSB1 bacterium]|nr:sulfatase-like hydrolase/transferase [candidate division KSB1 bacterium]